MEAFLREARARKGPYVEWNGMEHFVLLNKCTDLKCTEWTTTKFSYMFRPAFSVIFRDVFKYYNQPLPPGYYIF